MAATITDLIDRVSDSSTGRPIIATLAAPGKALAAASINLTAATNWTTTTAIHFSIYETTTVGSTVIKNSSTQTDWKGTLSGVVISNLTITGGTDRAYTAGAIVELTPTSRYAKDMYDWAITGHNQNGTHKTFTETSIVPTLSIQDLAVTTAKLNDLSVTTAKIADDAVTTAKLNLSKTTDANGWTVYDYGSWKEYVITKQWTAGTPASLAVVSTTIPYPSGLTATAFVGATTAYVANVTTVGPTASEIFNATTNIAATTGANMTIYVKNVHSAAQAFGSVTTSVRVVEK